MPRQDDRIFCPDCDVSLPDPAVDWRRRRATCRRCGREIELEGYLEPPSEVSPEELRPADLPRPRGLKAQKAAAPGVEIFNLGGRIGGGQLRLDRDNLSFKGLFGQERRTPLDQVAGFAARQHVAYSDTTKQGYGKVRWHLVAVLAGGTLLRLWETQGRDEARYLASELNRSLRFIRERAAEPEPRE